MRIAIVIFLVAVGSTAATADIFIADHPTFGVGSITRDTDQGLDFLDVILSISRSFDDVSGEFGVGGDFEGFRYATEVEVLALLNFVFSPDVAPGGASSMEQTGTAWDGLVDALGPTDVGVREHIVDGITSTAVGATEVREVRAGHKVTSSGIDFITASPSQEKSLAVSTFGSFLVQTAVPEPSAFHCLGLVGLGLMLWKKLKPSLKKG